MDYKIAFIGAGRMAGAMIGGLLSKNVYGKGEIAACAPTQATRDRMSQTYGIDMFEAAKDLQDKADVFVLAVKPKNIAPLFREEGTVLKQGSLLISIAAGVKISTLASYAPGCRIVRVMPNHCCLVFEGASGYVMGPGCTDADREAVKTLLEATGKAVEVREQDLDAVTGVSGSSPAFIYMFADAIIKAGVKHGLTEEQSKLLVAQSLIGSGRMILDSGMSVEALIDGVCSPGGTTIEGVKVLREGNLDDLTERCIDATVARSIEMGKE